MKNVLHSLLAVVTVLFMAACSEDQLSNERGNEVNVTFTTNLAGAIQSKAISDGLTVDELIFKVFKKGTNGEYSAIAALEQTVSVSGKQATVNVQLAKGETYSFLFWAQKSGKNFYTVGEDGSISVTYGTGANDEDRDAFYAVIDQKAVDGAFSMDVTLRRPFAQINLGTEDKEKAVAAGVTLAELKSSITVKDIPTKLNAFTGEVGEKQDVTFTPAAIPALSGETLTVKEKEYYYLGMNYILVESEKALVDATVTIEGTEEDITLELPGLPVQRNYRTNVLGNLLTANGNFNIIVDEQFNQEDHVYSQLLLAFANGGEVTLTEDVTLTEPLVVAAGKNVVLNLNGHTLNGALNVSENARLTVNEGEIVNMDENVSAIISNGTLILNDVKITSARHALRIESGSVVINGGYYTVDPQSKMTLYALNVGDDGTVANVTIKGGTFIGPKGTIADSGAAVGVKAGSTVTIEGGNFSGGKNNTLSNKGTLTVNGGIFDQDPSQYVAEGYQAVQVGDHYLVVPATTISASNVESFTAALNNPEVGVVELEEKIENVGLGFEVKRDVVFNMDNKEFNAGSDANSKWYAIQAYGENEVVINNANFTRAGIAALDGADVVFNSGVINHKPERSSRYIFLAGGEGSTVTINDGTFTNDRAKNSYFYAYNNGTIYVKGGTFNGVKSNNKIVTVNGGNVIITGGTFNFDPSNWVAEGYKATKSGDTWTVSAVQ